MNNSKNPHIRTYSFEMSLNARKRDGSQILWHYTCMNQSISIMCALFLEDPQQGLTGENAELISRWIRNESFIRT